MNAKYQPAQRRHIMKGRFQMHQIPPMKTGGLETIHILSTFKQWIAMMYR